MPKKIWNQLIATFFSSNDEWKKCSSTFRKMWCHCFYVVIYPFVRKSNWQKLITVHSKPSIDDHTFLFVVRLMFKYTISLINFVQCWKCRWNYLVYLEQLHINQWQHVWTPLPCNRFSSAPPCSLCRIVVPRRQKTVSLSLQRQFTSACPYIESRRLMIVCNTTF